MSYLSDGLRPEESRAIASKYQLNELDRKIIAFISKFPGSSDIEMARALGVKAKEITESRNKPAYKKAFEEYCLSTDELILRGQQQAVKVLINMLSDTNRTIRFKAAQLLLSPKLSAKAAGNSQGVSNAVVFQTRIGNDGHLRQQISQLADDEEVELKPLKGEVRQ